MVREAKAPAWRRAMEDGCTAFSVQGTHPDYFGEGGGNKGQQSAYWGNPPICFGFPSEEEPPLVVDAATCIMADYYRGPEYDALQELIPAAFFKSMGYTAVSSIFGGAFAGTDSAAAAALAAKWPGGSHGGGLTVIMDLGLFANPDTVRKNNDIMVRGVRQTMKPVIGYEEATLPGTPEYRNEETRSRDGIPLGSEEVDILRDVAGEFKVDLPTALRV